MKTSVTKYIIGAIIVIAIALYAVWSGNDASTVALSIPPITGGTTPNASSSSSSSTGSTTAGSGTPNPSKGSNGQYKDGTYTGSVADAFYGQLQVIATISDGALTSMTFPVYPNDPGHTADVTESAIPTLVEEAITAQSANVQVVSGATQTSEAFQESLAAALAQAH